MKLEDRALSPGPRFPTNDEHGDRIMAATHGEGLQRRVPLASTQSVGDWRRSQLRMPVAAVEANA
jgi:hypothetical protein